MSDIDIPLRERRLDELFRLDGRIAVITGAGQGIGLAIAMRLAEAGAAVVIADISAASAERAAVAVAERHRVEALPFVMDVRDEAAVHKGAALAVSRLGGLDIWVNNAGIYPRLDSVDVSAEDFERVLAINVLGTQFGISAAAQRMIAAGTRGVIINIASTAAWRGSGAYSASKWAVRGMTHGLGADLGRHGIRAVAIAPTVTDTPGMAEWRATATDPDDTVERSIAKNPLGRLAEPDDVARLAVFLASDAASFINSTTVVVDGGSLAAI